MFKDSVIKQREVLDSCQVNVVAIAHISSGTCQVKFYIGITMLKSTAS